jgi:hypothetical protein
MTSKDLAKKALGHLQGHIERLYTWQARSSFQNGEEAHELANILQQMQQELLELQELVAQLEMEGGQ